MYSQQQYDTPEIAIEAVFSWAEGQLALTGTLRPYVMLLVCDHDARAKVIATTRELAQRADPTFATGKYQELFASGGPEDLLVMVEDASGRSHSFLRRIVRRSWRVEKGEA